MALDKFDELEEEEDPLDEELDDMFGDGDEE